MRLTLVVMAAVLASAAPARGADGPPAPPSVVVTGHGIVAAAPDQVVLRLGAAVQAPQADAAQRQVNQIIQRALEGLRQLGVPQNMVQSVGITLSPVYEAPDPRARPGAPRLAGYRAGQTLQVRLDDVRRAGQVLDTAVAAGANQLEDPRFRLADEAPARQAALRLAVRDARAKAEAMAQALGARLLGVTEAVEGSPVAIRPRFETRLAAAPADVGTTVEPGQLQIEATVTIRYLIEPETGLSR